MAGIYSEIQILGQLVPELLNPDSKVGPSSPPGSSDALLSENTTGLKKNEGGLVGTVGI